MQLGESMEGAFQVVKLLSRRPSHWEQCVIIARLKFEKYFKRKVIDLEVEIQMFILILILEMDFKPQFIVSLGPTTVALLSSGYKVKRWK